MEVRMMDEQTQVMPGQQKDRRQRGEGRVWLVGKIWWVQYYVRGRQVRESSKSRTRTVADRLLKRRLAEVEANLVAPPDARRLRYEQLRNSLLADYRTNHRKSMFRKTDGTEQICGLKHLDAFFKEYRAVDITTDLVREFITKRHSDGALNSTVNRSLALLRRMFFLAKKDNKLRDIPYFPMLTEPPARKGFLDSTDFQRLRLALPEHLRPVLTLGFYSGMRLGEIKKLRWPNVNLLDRQISLDAGTTKNGEARIIPLMGELPEMLSMLRKKNTNSEFVFTRGGNPLVSFRKAWMSACLATNLGRLLCRTCHTELDLKRRCSKCGKKIAISRAVYEGLIFHDLRRAGVRNLVRAGVPQSVAQAISGHKTRAVFERYNIVDERDLRDAWRKLENYLANENGANSGQVANTAPNRHPLTN
jgi:integrase